MKVGDGSHLDVKRSIVIVRNSGNDSKLELKGNPVDDNSLIPTGSRNVRKMQSKLPHTRNTNSFLIRRSLSLSRKKL